MNVCRIYPFYTNILTFIRMNRVHILLPRLLPLSMICCGLHSNAPICKTQPLFEPLPYLYVYDVCVWKSVYTFFSLILQSFHRNMFLLFFFLLSFIRVFRLSFVFIFFSVSFLVNFMHFSQALVTRTCICAHLNLMT